MNLSDISSNSVLGRLLRAPLRVLPKSAALPILQGKLRGCRWIVGSSNHGCWLGSYEYQQRLVFEQHIMPGSTVFDIGAHVGFYTLLASVLVGSTGRVFAFEPLAENLTYLREHLRLNHAYNVTVVDAAVADRCGSSRFAKGPNRAMGRINAEGELQVHTVTLDALVKNEDLPAPDCIKMDIEGSELFALMGAEKLLEKHHPTIFLSTHGADIHRECCRYLCDMNYELLSLNTTDIVSTREILARHSNRIEGSR